MWRFALVIAVLSLAVVALGCEPGRIPLYENATSQRVTVYQDGIPGFSLGPHESITIPMFKEDWEPSVKVVAEDGRVLLEAYITWDELKRMDYKIVITDASSATPSPVATRSG